MDFADDFYLLRFVEVTCLRCEYKETDQSFQVLKMVSIHHIVCFDNAVRLDDLFFVGQNVYRVSQIQCSTLGARKR